MIREYDFISPYVEDLKNVIDLEIDPRRRIADRGGSPGRGFRGLLGTHRPKIRIEN